jgi:hypothetical protein
MVAEYKELSTTDIRAIEKNVRDKGAAIDQLIHSRHSDKKKAIILNISKATNKDRLLKKLFSSSRIQKLGIEIWIYQNDVLTKHKAK